MKRDKGDFRLRKEISQRRFILSAIPVSYTHLDVYKRQAFRFRILKSFDGAVLKSFRIFGKKVSMEYHEHMNI